MNRTELMRAATVMAANPSCGDDEVVQLLVDDGFDSAVAHRLVAFLPSAFARPVLESLGVSNFSNKVSVPRSESRCFSVRLSDQPEYVAALDLAREHRAIGIIEPHVFESIVNGTAEINAVSNALNEGIDVRGATVAVALNYSGHADHVMRPRLWSLRW